MARILVVEDDPSMNEILVETLSDEGHEVQSAVDGNMAIKLAERESFDLVISDVRLPGMDGVETLKSLKKHDSQLKCIIITGYASADTPVRAIRLKVDDYLFKPFSLDYFLNIVNRVLAQEVEKESRSALVEKLYVIFGRSKNSALQELVAERQEAFRGLYLGSRSGYLGLSAAWEVYSKLEELEGQFRSQLNKDNPNKAEILDLRAAYTQLGDRIAVLELGSKTVDTSPPSPLPEAEFEALYEAMKSSHIGLDDLQYAPLLRETPDNRFETHQKLLELKHRLWPKLN